MNFTNVFGETYNAKYEQYVAKLETDRMVTIPTNEAYNVNQYCTRAHLINTYSEPINGDATMCILHKID